MAAVIALAGELDLPLKFTAGLHHPVRRRPPDPDVMMHGFLNVFGAGILARGAGLAGDDLIACLAETDPAAFRFDDETFAWRGLRVDAAAVAAGPRRDCWPASAAAPSSNPATTWPDSASCSRPPRKDDPPMDPTVDPAVRSFLDVDPDSHFPLQNLPYGVFSPGPADEPPHRHPDRRLDRGPGGRSRMPACCGTRGCPGACSATRC